MVPPPGVPDSTLVAARNGASLEPYHGALASQVKNYSMESNDDRIKKNWGEKWKVTKPGKSSVESEMIETSNFMVHPDYLNKYGTLSNGVLTKSIKYAETWLYGTVGVRGGPSQRPSLFLYPGVVAPPPRIVNQNSYLTSSSGFPGAPTFGYPSPERGGIVLPRRLQETRFLEHQPRRCSDCGKDVRLGILCKKCGEKRTGSCRSVPNRNQTSSKDTLRTRAKNSSLDPYNLMRKTRLGEGEKSQPSIFSSEFSGRKVRTSSASPTRRKKKESPNFTFETFKPKQSDKETKPKKNTESDGSQEKEVVRRKSILECDVNAYELNKVRGEPKDDDDEVIEEFEKGFSVDSKIKISRPKLNKTEVRKDMKEKFATEKTKCDSERLKKSEVRLNGQRFKIFDHSSSPSTSVVEGYVSDDEEPLREKEEAEVKDPSPKRPPRRAKTKAPLEIGFWYSKSKSKSSPNLSIKSILKKPPIGDDLGLADFVIRDKEASSRNFEFQSEPSSHLQDLGHKNQTQITLKKKKQVQFRVNGSCESLSQKRRSWEENTALDPCESLAPEAPEAPQDPGVQRSKSCENLSFVVNAITIEGESDVQTQKSEQKDAAAADQNLLSFLVEDNNSDEKPWLRRSFSDRRPSSSLTLHKDDFFLSSAASSNENLFNDTMALRKRATRINAKEMFFDEKENLEEKKPKNLLLDLSGRENEFSKTSAPTISYAEFSKQMDFASTKENSLEKTCEDELKLEKDFSNLRETESSAPHPPPRVTPSVKTNKAKIAGATSVTISGCQLLESNQSESSCNRHNEKGNLGMSSKVQANSGPKIVREAENCKTILNLGSLKGNPTTESSSGDEKGTSITIHQKNVAEESVGLPQRKTSVIIHSSDPKAVILRDDNKVRIKVRNEPTEEEDKEGANSSTCTIIETGSNSTVIPVMSTDNKTTLIVGSTSSSAPPVTLDHNIPQSFVETEVCKMPSQYIFSMVNSESENPVELMDPVEAVRRNLIPHICGKEENSLTLMEKIKQSRETKDQINLNQIKKLFGDMRHVEEMSAEVQASQFLLASYRLKKQNCKLSDLGSKAEEDFSPATSRSSSFCSTLTSPAKNSSGNTSRSSSFKSCSCKSIDGDYDSNQALVSSLAIPRNKFYVCSDAEDIPDQEKDKLEYEYEIRNGFKDDKRDEIENIYETISEEPIYDKIEPRKNEGGFEEEDDVPPPLPLTSPPSLDEIENRLTKSIFEGASKYDILNYLVDAKERVKEESYFSGSSTSEDVDSRRLSFLEENERLSAENGTSFRSPSLAEPAQMDKSQTSERCKRLSTENDSGIEVGSRINHASQTSYSSDDNVGAMATPDRGALKLARKSSAEIERNDSGVGSETSHTSRSKWQSSASIREDPHHLCEDCDQVVETQITDSGVMYAPLVCRKCSKRRSERKEIIQEIVETEEKYGRDLKIILEEFYTPMLVAGLLTPDQLAAIFLNTEELLENSEQLTEKLRDALEIAIDQGDEDLLTVNVGKHFLEAGPMLHAFETYCTRQGAAALLLTNLEKEKELLRIFLRVSQMENAVLRRMNLNSFLMVPVQRVTKYPLLLARLYKVTPPQQEARELLKEAQHNIELHLEHMNSEAKDVSATKVWRRFSTSTVSGRKSTAELEMINIKLRKMAVDVLDWNHEEVRFVMEGKLLYTQPTDSNWKRGRTIKLTPIFVLLATLGKPNSKYKLDPPEDELTFPAKTGIREATLLLVKEKCGRYTLIREPLYLDKVIVCCETDVDEYFEVQELSTKDSFIFKAEDGERTKEWYRHLQYHAQILGAWRRRRNALANIMINGMMARAYTS